MIRLRVPFFSVLCMGTEFDIPNFNLFESDVTASLSGNPKSNFAQSFYDIPARDCWQPFAQG